jgi:hypothetical protein
MCYQAIRKCKANRKILVTAGGERDSPKLRPLLVITSAFLFDFETTAGLTMPLEALSQITYPISSLGMDFATFRLVD